MKVLVFGGTRYFGKILVQNLLDSGHDVTIVTRGLSRDTFGDSVTRLIADRQHQSELTNVLGNGWWDVAFDQIGYSPNDSMVLCNVLKKRIGRLIYVSSQSVYNVASDIKEVSFNPFDYPVVYGSREDFSYDEGKRLSEAAYHKHAEFNVSYVRFPIVLGIDDYTKRLNFHVDRIKEGMPIYFPALESKISFVEANQAARFLSWLMTEELYGPVNACSSSPIKLSRFIEIIENITDRRANLSLIESAECFSPFGITGDWYMNADLVKNRGYQFTEIEQWLPELIEHRNLIR